MRFVVVAPLVVLAGCGNSNQSKQSEKSDSDSLQAIAKKGPAKGVIDGKPFNVNHAIVLERIVLKNPFGPPDGPRVLSRKIVLYALAPGEQGKPACAYVGVDKATSEISTSWRPVSDWEVNQPADLKVLPPPRVDAGNARARAMITAVDAKTFKASGVIEISGEKGWALAGTFTGDYCYAFEKPRPNPKPVGQMAWTMNPVDPATIPAAPLAAVIAGLPAQIKYAQVSDYNRDGFALRFFNHKPQERCVGFIDTAFHSTGEKLEGPTEKAESFDVFFRKTEPKAGTTFKTNEDLADERGGFKGTGLTAAKVRWFEPAGQRMDESGDFNVALAIEQVTDEAVSGRLYLAFDDVGKSQLVGQFSAVRCDLAE
ncbi:MAG TPA: hypothetical protein VFG83_02555 [Kofleriaceae bacterium]|nr:hypothetical protein [Kofleriaceae bacterium]